MSNTSSSSPNPRHLCGRLSVLAAIGAAALFAHGHALGKTDSADQGQLLSMRWTVQEGEAVQCKTFTSGTECDHGPRPIVIKTRRIPASEANGVIAQMVACYRGTTPDKPLQIPCSAGAGEPLYLPCLIEVIEVVGSRESV